MLKHRKTISAARISVIAMFLLLGACAANRTLINTTSSIEEIPKQVLAAFERNDREALQAMRISKEEFRRLIWPGMPIGRSKAWKEQFNYVWGDVNTKSNYGLSSVLSAYGEKKFTYVDIKFKKGTQIYELKGKFPFYRKDSYIAHRDALVIVKDEEGREQALKLFGGIIEYKGKYKIMSFTLND